MGWPLFIIITICNVVSCAVWYGVHRTIRHSVNGQIHVIGEDNRLIVETRPLFAARTAYVIVVAIFTAASYYFLFT